MRRQSNLSMIAEMAFQPQARPPSAFSNGLSNSGPFNQPLLSTYWPEESADYFNTSLLQQYFGWPGFSALQTAKGNPSLTPGYSPFDISKLPDEIEKSDEELSKENTSEEKERRKKKTRKHYAKSKPDSRKSSSSNKRVSGRRTDEYDEEETRSSENHLGSVEYLEEDEELGTGKYKKMKEAKKSVKKVAKMPPQRRLPYESSTKTPAERRHHYHLHDQEGASEDQSCFCSIGKVGYMEPSYHPTPKYGHGEKSPKLLGYSIGLPVTAGVLALMTGIAAFLIALALQGVGREGNVIFKELWRTGSEDGVVELKADLGSLSTTTTEAPVQSTRRIPSSAFAPHRNQHRRMRRNLAAPRYSPVIWLVP